MPVTGLRVPLDNAKQKIDVQLDKGKTILHDTEQTSWTFWNPLESEVEGSEWVRQTRRILELVFYNDSLAREFDPKDAVTIVRAADNKVFFQRIMDDYLHRLESIYERLDLLPLGPVDEETRPGHETIPKPGASPESPYVFISHSSQDQHVIRFVTEAFEELELKPYFIEEAPQGRGVVGSICQEIEASEAMFAFLTSNSIMDRTRDWIVFELATAKAYNKPTYVWVHNQIEKERLPTFLSQLTTYRFFDPLTTEGVLDFRKDVRKAVKRLHSSP